MKQPIILTLLLLLFVMLAYSSYRPDILGDGFEQQTIAMGNDYEGDVTTTLVRTPKIDSAAAILYVHGYNDYFFQKEMSHDLNSNGYNFYAIDLRKYGRSQLSHQIPFHVLDLSEYFADIDTALSIMQNEGMRDIYLMGHSTGGLILSLYCDAKASQLRAKGLILNSPFLDMNETWLMETILIPITSFLGKYWPEMEVPSGVSSAYFESVHNSYHGEWDFDPQLKPRVSPPIRAGWIRAIHKGHNHVADGLDIQCPILLMHSDKSIISAHWVAEVQSADAVLDVNDMIRLSTKLGGNIHLVEIKDGLHDLILSGKDVREKALHEMILFLQYSESLDK